MTYIATITQKGQVTIPSDLFRRTSLKKGGRVIFSVQGDQVKLQSVLELINELAGSVKLSSKIKTKDLDKIIEQSKRDYFRNKWQAK